MRLKVIYSNAVLKLVEKNFHEIFSNFEENLSPLKILSKLTPLA